MRWSSPSPNIIAFLTSLAVAVGVNLFLFVLDFFIKDNFWWQFYVSNFFSILLVSLIVIHYALRTFIQKKIRIIYKTIGKPLKFQKEIKELRKLETYRREFVGNVSHELKTPIFNALGYIETLLDGGLEDEKILKDYLEKASANIERLETIVSDLLEVSKFESGQLRLEKEVFDVNELTLKVFYQYEIQAEENDVTLKIENEGIKTLVFADKKRILQVLENLISYAVFCLKKVIIRYIDLDEQLLVEVSDNGPGIAEKDIPRLFERFFRTDSGRSRKMGGTGLGLSIVKHIVESHDQTINIHSQPNIETTFSFTLEKVVQ